MIVENAIFNNFQFRLRVFDSNSRSYNPLPEPRLRSGDVHEGHLVGTTERLTDQSGTLKLSLVFNDDIGAAYEFPMNLAIMQAVEQP